jgi:hypothetical protein
MPEKKRQTTEMNRSEKKEWKKQKQRRERERGR